MNVVILVKLLERINRFREMELVILVEYIEERKEVVLFEL